MRFPEIAPHSEQTITRSVPRLSVPSLPWFEFAAFALLIWMAAAQG
ncbi:MAG: hypothetical protein U1D35_18815 [Paracoccaceae bacterium]|nr:hypothetical protein [Paracoccaceae bacterium]